MVYDECVCALIFDDMCMFVLSVHTFYVYMWTKKQKWKNVKLFYISSY